MNDPHEGALQGRVARGRAGEDIAALWLRLRGMTILDRNRRARSGEIDLIAREGETLVFVEVRLRRSGSWVSAADSIGVDKQRRLLDCARALARDPEFSWPGRRIRFDVVTLTADGAELRVAHLRSVRLLGR